MSNDGMLLVNFGALNQAGADINNAIKLLQTELERLEAEGKKLQSEWDGSAREAYEARQAKWRAASEELQTILTSIKGAVDSSAHDYLTTEKQAAARFQ